MIADRTIPSGAQRILEEIALVRLLPKIHCLRAQAKHRFNIRFSLSALIVSIQMNENELITKCEAFAEIHYRKLAKCKEEGCGGEWTEYCTNPELPNPRVDDSITNFGGGYFQVRPAFLERFLWLILGGILVALGRAFWTTVF